MRKTARETNLFPGLTKKLNLKSRQNEIDYDYLHKLTDKELDWLNRFSEEYIGANFKHPGKLIDKSVKGRKASYTRNNARNRCIYSLAEARNTIIYWDNQRIERHLDICEDDIWIKRIDEAE